MRPGVRFPVPPPAAARKGGAGDQREQRASPARNAAASREGRGEPAETLWGADGGGGQQSRVNADSIPPEQEA